METSHINACIELISWKGNPADICMLYNRLSERLKDRVTEFEMASRQYISDLLEMMNEGAFPFKFNPRNPRSVLYTATGLNLLYETKVMNESVMDEIIACLVKWQDAKGWWKDSTDLLEVNNLPFYQDPMDASVRIFNTASVGSILIKFRDKPKVNEAVDKAISVLKTAISSNGALIGFPQSTIYATPLFAKYFGMNSDEFLRHLEVLGLMMKSNPTTPDMVTIGEQLLLSQLPKNHNLIQICTQFLENEYTEEAGTTKKIGGWKTMKQFDPSLTLRALMFLIEKDSDHRISEKKNTNFITISPSALRILETRSYTSIPFAQESYEIISGLNSTELSDESFKISEFKSKDVNLPREIVLQIMHFEARYLSLDRGLEYLGCNKILELASGFSNRGLDFCKNPQIQYLDTDLPNIIESKKTLVSELIKRYCNYHPDNLNLKPLNALDEKEFLDVSAIFKEGPICIINEGLLMYLNLEQKEQLCEIVHKVLSKYGGYWITADIYNRGKIEGRKYYKQKDREFIEKHNIDQNRFASFEDAKDLFVRCGFEIHRKIELESNELTSSRLLSGMIETKPQEKTRETWILKPI